MLKPDLIKFQPKTLAKSEDVNYNFEELSNYVFGTANELDAAVKTAITNLNTQLTQSLFTGKIEMYAGNTDNIPSGWLLCDGRAVSRETYKNLYTKIGTKYGAGNGTTTFNLPNYIGRFLEGGTTAGTVKAAAIPNIKGTINSLGNGGVLWQGASTSGAFYTSGANASWDTASKGGSDNPKTLNFNASRSSSVYKDNVNTVQPPSVTVLYIIKT